MRFLVVLLAALTLACGLSQTAHLYGPNSCKHEVKVYVVNQGQTDIRLTFGNRVVRKKFLGGQTDSIFVNRINLTVPVRAVIAGGGMHIGPPHRIDTEPPICDVATIFLTQNLTGSMFFGADLR